MTARLSSAAVRPLDDLDWLDAAVGDARVVAIGESAHYNQEFFELRHRVLRHLVERHGFGAYAMESGFVEGRRVDGWIRGSDEPLGAVLADGLTSLMGMWTAMRSQLEWMRRQRVGFYGIDLPGSNASLLPGLDAVLAYLAEAEPDYEVDGGVRETAAAYAAESSFTAPQALAAYAALPQASRDGLTAGLADIAARLSAQRTEYLRRATADAHDLALRTMAVTVALDAMLREVTRGVPHPIHSSMRDATIADTVEWILRREDRIVLGAHNGHVQRWPIAVPGMLPPSSTMGMHLAERLGAGYLAIGTTSTSGRTLNHGADFFAGTLFADLEPPRAGSLDALMAASHDGPFAVDLRRLSPTDTALVVAASEHRIGALYGEIAPLEAFDVVVHLPHVGEAVPDADALAHAPEAVRHAFGSPADAPHPP